MSHQMNVLVDVIDNTPHARIADFGIAIVTKNPDSVRPATYQNIHTPAWSAPEVMRGENPSKESDVYSFAMIMLEVLCGRSVIRMALAYRYFALMQVLSGQAPFNELKSNYLIVMAVWEGKRPPRPAHPSCTDGLWRLIQRCWGQDPQLRPEIPEVSQTISSVSTG